MMHRVSTPSVVPILTIFSTLRKYYPDTKVFKLEQNYRSTQTIVRAANSLIEKNQWQIRKEVFSEKEKGEANWCVPGIQ